MKYRFILFDLDDTLLDFHATERDAFFATMESCGITATEEIYLRYHEINRLLWIDLAEGRVTREVLLVRRFADLLREIGSSDTDAEQIARTYESLLGENVYYTEGANETAEKLAARGCRLYIITNGTARAQKRRLCRCDFMKYVDEVFISQEIGYEKPAREFFDYAASRIPGFDPAAALVVGDSVTTDIRGGNRYGTDTCMYRPGLPARLSPAPHTDDDAPTYTVGRLSEILNLI